MDDTIVLLNILH